MMIPAPDAAPATPVYRLLNSCIPRAILIPIRFIVPGPDNETPFLKFRGPACIRTLSVSSGCIVP